MALFERLAGYPSGPEDRTPPRPDGGGEGAESAAESGGGSSFSRSSRGGGPARGGGAPGAQGGLANARRDDHTPPGLRLQQSTSW